MKTGQVGKNIKRGRFKIQKNKRGRFRIKKLKEDDSEEKLRRGQFRKKNKRGGWCKRAPIVNKSVRENQLPVVKMNVIW
jgi:hypothetical protein